MGSRSRTKRNGGCGMTECCKNCKYWKKLKHNFVVGKGFEHSHCCVLFVSEESEDCFCLETEANELCEMFIKKGGAE